MSKFTYKNVKYRTVGTALFIVYLIYNRATCFGAVRSILWLFNLDYIRRYTLVPEWNLVFHYLLCL